MMVVCKIKVILIEIYNDKLFSLNAIFVKVTNYNLLPMGWILTKSIVCACSVWLEGCVCFGNPGFMTWLLRLKFQKKLCKSMRVF